MKPGRVVGIVPAAGFATRLQPLRVSKEVYPIASRPVMDYLVERMQFAGCDELRVVTRPEKKDVTAHAHEVGAQVIFARPGSVSESLVAGMDGLAAEDVVLIGFPDTLWDPPDGYRRLVERLDGTCVAALGLFTFPEPQRSDVVTLEGEFVQSVEVKPARPPSNLVWGCAAARVAALEGLDGTEWPGEHFNALCRRATVAGIYLSDRFVDVGTKPALAQIQTELDTRS